MFDVIEMVTLEDGDIEKTFIIYNDFLFFYKKKLKILLESRYESTLRKILPLPHKSHSNKSFF